MNNDVLKIFMLGYGGANNTGSEIRILTIIDDVRAVFGDSINITLGTLDREKTSKIINETEYLKIVEIPYIFPLAVWRLAKKHNILMLIEGSTFKDNWSSALLYLFLWGGWAAKRHGKYSLAYAVDAGQMSSINQYLTRLVCQEMDLIITRTKAAKQKLHDLGIQREIFVTTDTAFQFQYHPVETTNVPVVGIAPVEFYKWPVHFKLWGPRELCYHWPYYFSWDSDRAQQSEILVEAWVKLIQHIINERGWRIKLIAMEELDRNICNRILDRVQPQISLQIEKSFAGERSPQDIANELQRLSFLVTSRYHACVLSMNGGVPQMALYHDERLSSIYQELGLSDYAVEIGRPDLFCNLKKIFEQLVLNAPFVSERLCNRFHSYYLPSSKSNREILKNWYQDAIIKKESRQNDL